MSDGPTRCERCGKCLFGDREEALWLGWKDEAAEEDEAPFMVCTSCLAPGRQHDERFFHEAQDRMVATGRPHVVLSEEAAEAISAGARVVMAQALEEMKPEPGESLEEFMDRFEDAAFSRSLKRMAWAQGADGADRSG